MIDPYKVLNITSDASDEDVKKAYRELARKYHPDNYHDNPLADLAQEKMKEINEAYELIQKQRKGSSAQSAQTAYGGYQYSTAGSSPLLREVRLALSRGDISTAERLLAQTNEHNAEWNFLRGVVCYRRGWLDEARRHFETACHMEPNNAEYRNTFNALSGQGYCPQGYKVYTTRDCGGDSFDRMCMAWLCCSLLGGGSGCYFLPCFC